MSSEKDVSQLNRLPNVNRTWEEIISSAGGGAPMAVASPEEGESVSHSATETVTRVEHVPTTVSHTTSSRNKHNGTPYVCLATPLFTLKPFLPCPGIQTRSERRRPVLPPKKKPKIVIMRTPCLKHQKAKTELLKKAHLLQAAKIGLQQQ